MTLYLINGAVVGGPCIDLSGLSRLSRMRHPQRSREVLAVFDQVEGAGIDTYQIRFAVTRRTE